MLTRHYPEAPQGVCRVCGNLESPSPANPHLCPDCATIEGAMQGAGIPAWFLHAAIRQRPREAAEAICLLAARVKTEGVLPRG